MRKANQGMKPEWPSSQNTHTHRKHKYIGNERTTDRDKHKKNLLLTVNWPVTHTCDLFLPGMWPLFWAPVTEMWGLLYDNTSHKRCFYMDTYDSRSYWNVWFFQLITRCCEGFSSSGWFQGQWCGESSALHVMGCSTRNWTIIQEHHLSTFSGVTLWWYD